MSQWLCAVDVLLAPFEDGVSSRRTSVIAALAHGVPGHIVFPVTTGGSLFFVAAAGIVFFKERVGLYGAVGICLGICSLVLLSIS